MKLLKRLTDFLSSKLKNMKKSTKTFHSDSKLKNKSNSELLSLMRHESHRIEKSIYNKIFHTKNNIYVEKKELIIKIHHLLEAREVLSDPTIEWSKKIIESFYNLEEGFINIYRKKPNIYNEFQLEDIQKVIKERRSIRTWNEKQPKINEFNDIASLLIDAARWAPCSGNRQPWRFKVIIESHEKELLRGLKENHCVVSPMLIFIGMDSRLYGAYEKNVEQALFLDAGAAIMQMITVATYLNLGTCWNHLSKEVIFSREQNKSIYKKFTTKLSIPSYIEPIALLSVGYPNYIPPVPSKTNVGDLLL